MTLTKRATGNYQVQFARTADPYPDFQEGDAIMETKWRNRTLGLQIPPSLLDGACQRFSEVLLLCLPQANSVTSFLVGSVPHLRITCLGTAARNRETNEIQWCKSTPMDSGLSGKTWKDVCHSSCAEPTALSACLRNQMTWTSSGSKADFNKAVEKSSGKVSGNHFHLEPVLIKKDALWDSMPPPSVYPKDKGGKTLWLDSDCVAAALMKIDLTPESFPLDPNYWEITEKLTEALATQLLHLHSKQSLSKKTEKIAEERNEIIEILIIQIRQIMTKLGVVYRVIDNEADHLRQTWENLIHEHNPEQPCRPNIIKQLNLLLKSLDGDHNGGAESEIVEQLEWYQNKLAEFCFLPKENELWFQQKITPLWENTAARFNPAPEVKKQIKELLDKLEQSFYVGLNETLVDKIDTIPKSIKSKWTDLAYNAEDLTKGDLLQEYIHLLEQTNIELPNKRKTIENLLCLKILALYIENLESKLNKYFDKYETNIQAEQVHLH